MANTWTTITPRDSLSPRVEAIGEVRVQGRVQRPLDSERFTFSKEEKALAHNTLSLLKSVPGMYEDILSGQIKSANGESVIILISGKHATANEIRMIPKGRVKHVEQFNSGKAQFAGAGNILNIVTKPYGEGFVLGFSAKHALTTVYGDDQVYFSAFYKHHKLSVDYSFNLRDYTDSRDSEWRAYAIGPKAFEQSLGIKRAFGYSKHVSTIKYSYSIKDVRDF